MYVPLSFCVEFYNNLSKKQLFIYQEKEKSFTIEDATIKTGQHKTKAIDRKNMKSFVRRVSVFSTSRSLNGYKIVFGLYRTVIDTFFPKQTTCSMSSFHLIL